MKYNRFLSYVIFLTPAINVSNVHFNKVNQKVNSKFENSVFVHNPVTMTVSGCKFSLSFVETFSII